MYFIVEINYLITNIVIRDTIDNIYYILMLSIRRI